MSTDRLDSLYAELRARGERLTKARRAVLRVLAEGPDHLAADDILAAVREAEPDVHLATVYRTLDTLRDNGIIEHTHLGHGPAVYHLADDLHQHLVCESCGRVIEVPTSILRALERRLRDDYGFSMRPAHFAIVGRCKRCS